MKWEYHAYMRAGRKVSSFLKHHHGFQTTAQNEGTIIAQRCVEIKSSRIACAVLRTITWHIFVYPIDMNINFHSKGTCKEVMRLLRIGKFVECIIYFMKTQFVQRNSPHDDVSMISVGLDFRTKGAPQYL